SPPRGIRSWTLRETVLLELQGHLAEREVGLHPEHDARLLDGEPDAGVLLLTQDAARVGDLRPDHDRIPLAPGDADAVPAQHFDDDRILLRAEVAAEDRKSTRLNSSHEWSSYAVL